MAIFDDEATGYDQWYHTGIGQYADRVETDCAFHLFQVKPGMRILDVGCGTGNFSIKLARKGAMVTGIDLSEKMLMIARRRALQEKLDITFKQMDVLHLGFSDHFFDGVLSMATIEFVPDHQRMISEMFRVCRKNGPILVGTINRESDWGRLYQNPEFQKDVPVFKHAHFKSPPDVIQLKKEFFVAVQECLFIPPDTPDSEISLKKEQQFSSLNRGGFFCVLWKKTE